VTSTWGARVVIVTLMCSPSSPPLDDPESAENVPRSITPGELIEVAWKLGRAFAATSCVTPGRRPADPCCVEQELSSSDMRPTSPQVSTIDLTKLR
jgi:hypothetical protein